VKGWLALLLAWLGVGLVVGGCGNAETSEQPAKQSGGGGGAQVSMENIEFEPANVTIETGATVTWTNDDTLGHDVTGDDFKSGAAGGLQSGDTFEHTFSEPGTYDYVCTVHPGMKGSVTVK
jgi:plastocyanin